MKTYYGSYEITKAMGYSLANYIKITNFLNLINVPMERNKKGVLTYYLTEKQVEVVKNALEMLRENLRKEK